MNFRRLLPLVCLLISILTSKAQIPGFIEKWRVNLDDTNDQTIEAIGRDGAVLLSALSGVLAYPASFAWISPSGELISKIPGSEIYTTNAPYPNTFIAVLVLSSNLVIQTQSPPSNGQPPTMPMQITQFTRSGGPPVITKTIISATRQTPYGARAHALSDFSCPERLMFVQQGAVFICYRPAADIATPLTALTLGNVSQTNADLLITSSQGGPMQLQSSTNLTSWQTVTNLPTVPGISKFKLPVGSQQRLFYRGVTQ